MAQAKKDIPENIGPLTGIRALDFGMAAVGPVTMTHLALLGADVIKIESPRGDIVRSGANSTIKGMGFSFVGNNLNKRAIVLDLKSDADREIALKLIATVDVALDNFRSGEIMERLGLGWDVVSKVNPRLIYLQSSAYGSVGPMDGMLSHEWFTQAAAGHASVSGKPGGLPQILRGSAHLDWNGAMVNVIGILMALHAREKSGRGVFMQTSQFQSTITAGFTRWAEFFTSGKAPEPMGSARGNIVPDQAFETAFGHVSVSVLNNGIWARFCQAMESPELLSDPRFVTNEKRVENRDELIPLLEEKFKRTSAWHWLRTFRRHGVPSGEYFEGKPRSHVALEHPQVRAINTMTVIDSPWGPLNTSNGFLRFSKTPTRINRSPPLLDEHRDEVLEEMDRLWASARAEAGD